MNGDAAAAAPHMSAGAGKQAQPAWQTALVAGSLGLFSLFVVLPTLGALLFIWTLVLLALGARALDAVGALDPAAYSGAVYLTGAMLAITTAAWTLGKLSDQRRATRAQLPSPRAVSRASWAVRHPWLSAAIACAFVDVVLIPVDMARLVDVPDGFVGAGILGALVLAEIGAFYVLVRSVRFFLRSIWRLTRRSAFAAGAVSACSLATALGAYLLASALGALGTALAGVEPVPKATTCNKPALACSRELLASAARQPHAAPAAALPPAEPRDVFAECVEELHRDDPTRGNTYRDALAEALRRVRDVAQAQDVVHDTLIDVCLIADRIGDVRSYFIRSVRNRAGEAARRSRRYCSVVPEVPDWPPDQCVTGSVEALYIQAEAEAAAHDALCSLDRIDKTVIQLHVWHNLPHRDIGQRLGWPEATARQRYHRAVSTLREEFRSRCR